MYFAEFINRTAGSGSNGTACTVSGMRYLQEAGSPRAINTSRFNWMDLLNVTYVI